MTTGADFTLRVRDLVAGYGRMRVLEGVSLDARDGEFVTVVGANGAGKTTLLRAIMGLIPASGEIRRGGVDLLREPAHRRVGLGIAYVPEGRHVFPTLTVEENLRVPGGRGDGDRRDRAEAMRDVYEVFPRLAQRRQQAAGSLSGGEQQMLALGRALVLDPDLLIVDEISLGLAPIVVDAMFSVLARMHAAGKTILLVEQNARAALEAADTGYVLDSGRVALSGDAAELERDPRVIAAYLQNF